MAIWVGMDIFKGGKNTEILSEFNSLEVFFFSYEKVQREKLSDI